ncbi:MAG: hypothetical protein HFH62_03160 [Lachnospiraceae bacterium]|nr:hypothetical protein [Lachnospiraceae bacterium]
MKAELKKNSINQIIKGMNIFEAGDAVTEIGLVIKGRVRIQAEGVNLMVGSGNFLGLCDLDGGVHSVTYVAETNLAVYSFASAGMQGTVAALIKAKKDYAPLMVSTLCKYIRELYKIYSELEQGSSRLWKFITDSYQTYQNIGKNTGITVMALRGIEDLGEYQPGASEDQEKVEYYRACAEIPPEVQKAYFSCSGIITMYHIKEQAALVGELISRCKNRAEYLRSLADLIILNDKSLYHSVLQQVTMLQRVGENAAEASSLFDDVIDQINSLENLLLDRAGIDLQIDHDFMEQAYYQLLSGGGSNSNNATLADGDIALVEHNFVDVGELSGALDIILDYGELDGEQQQSFREYIQSFIDMQDKFATDDEARTLRRNIIKTYYDLYQKVFLKDYQSSEDTPLVIDLFLRYGFLSEKLVTDSIMEELLGLDTSHSGMGACSVYDMKEWLTLIIKGEKEPSKSEFDLDYDENLREMKKTGQITAEMQQEMSHDTNAKFEYELQNMFKVNHRLMFSQATAFVPFMFTECCTSSIDRSYLSKDKVNATIQRLKQIDFSVFYRESLYSKEGSAFTKEFIQEEVYPDIVMFPGYGNKGVMWQEISGRRRNSKGRFLLPIFMEGELDADMIKLLGRFRWELCRTIQGSAWNNIQIKSLTSEYSDFVQFYKKNRELSEDKKQKLKMQIQKCRNNTREVFVQDYENWIKHEANGGLLLSKPVREIMATYCPFSKELREKVGEQPMFRDAMAKFMRERGKKIKEYDLKFKVWQKDDIEVPEEILETKRFYIEY